MDEREERRGGERRVGEGRGGDERGHGKQTYDVDAVGTGIYIGTVSIYCHVTSPFCSTPVSETSCLQN